MRRGLALVLFLLFTLTVAAAPRVEVVGLFAGKAVLVIDGQRRLLSVGERSPEGVRLLAADSRRAVVEVAGARRVLSLSHAAGGSYAERERRVARVSPDNRGRYRTTGSINGLAVDFLIDTGATTVALSAPAARRLGIAYQRQGTRVRVATASGSAAAFRVMLDEVVVGDIRLRNIPAVVIDGPQPQTPLLGMSFLGRVSMRHEGRMLVLEQR